MNSTRFGLALLVGVLALAACKDKPTEPPPATGIDVSAYFILPDSGFDKLYNDGTTQTYAKDTIVSGHAVSDLRYSDGRHVFFRKSDRAWVATLGSTGGWFELDPPLVAPPPVMPFLTEITAASSAIASPSNVPLTMMSQLVDTGLLLTVPAGTYDSVILVRQVFRLFGKNGLGIPETTVDSTYRWFAPGIDEIRRVSWDVVGDSLIREFSFGSAGI